MVRTIAELFYEALNYDFPDALAYKKDGRYVGISHRELQAAVERLALAMHRRGLRPGDRVAILSENRPEWAMADYACAVSGLVSVPVYPTLNPEHTAQILRHSGARWVFCSRPEQLAKVQSCRASLPELELVIPMDAPTADSADLTVLPWAELMDEGAALEDRRPEVRRWAQLRRPWDVLTLVYTSGTTGEPKGAMVTHGNIIANIAMARPLVRIPERGRCLSFLPLSHSFERMAGHYAMLHCGISIYYAESHATLAENLLEVRPHMLMAVPRVYEKIYAKVREAVADQPLLQRCVFKWALAAGLRVAPFRYRELRPGPVLRLAMKLADALVFGRLRALTGDRLTLAISGGAALGPKVLAFFWAMGVPIHEGYGLTETGPILALNARGHVGPGTVGQPLLESWKGQPLLKLAPDGEVLARGPNIMAGYWRDDEATREAFDEDGYFRTGDIGQWDGAGRLCITDRKKEILVTSGGKNVAPQPIENLLRADKYIAQAVLLGDRRNFVSAILVPNFHVLRRWAAYKRLGNWTDAELVALPQVQAKLLRRVERVNARLSNFERVKKILVLDQEMTQENGLLTPSLKVMRREVDRQFRERIEALYAGGNGS